MIQTPTQNLDRLHIIRFIEETEALITIVREARINKAALAPGLPDAQLFHMAILLVTQAVEVVPLLAIVVLTMLILPAAGKLGQIALVTSLIIMDRTRAVSPFLVIYAIQAGVTALAVNLALFKEFEIIKIMI